MSSPLHSLKKGPKSRMFVGTGLSLDSISQRPVPFRQPHYTEDETKLLDEITTNIATSRIKTHNAHGTSGNTGPSPLPAGSGLPKISRLGHPGSSMSNHSNTSSGAPSDKDLMSLMMNKITLLEQRVQYQNKDIVDKDKRIHILEEKLKILKKASDSSEPSRPRELEKKCLLLKQQIHEMETFLSDYGMVWLGDKSSEESEVYLEEEEGEVEEEGEEEDSSTDDGGIMWRPGSSVSSVRPFQINFDQLIENIKDLNILAGEGLAKVTKTTDGARLKIPEAVPITLFNTM
ncbi:UBX domain-containing protein 11 [Patella vulgata]|uniref:UBX domain-containing protein 11 n=1 Tax=Patella vulgata TaxID=6465 RepID=UPI00217F81C2|nr:UBX domain-containing protein 11 [Patella vulgata]